VEAEHLWVKNMPKTHNFGFEISQPKVFP